MVCLAGWPLRGEDRVTNNLFCDVTPLQRYVTLQNIASCHSRLRLDGEDGGQGRGTWGYVGTWGTGKVMYRYVYRYVYRDVPQQLCQVARRSGAAIAAALQLQWPSQCTGKRAFARSTRHATSRNAQRDLTRSIAMRSLKEGIRLLSI